MALVRHEIVRLTEKDTICLKISMDDKLDVRNGITPEAQCCEFTFRDAIEGELPKLIRFSSISQIRCYYISKIGLGPWLQAWVPLLRYIEHDLLVVFARISLFEHTPALRAHQSFSGGEILKKSFLFHYIDPELSLNYSLSWTCLRAKMWHYFRSLIDRLIDIPFLSFEDG